MAATLAQQEVSAGYVKTRNNTQEMPDEIRALFRDLSNIRMTTLVESPQLLPLIAPALVEAEVHIRQIWQAQY